MELSCLFFSHASAACGAHRAQVIYPYRQKVTERANSFILYDDEIEGQRHEHVAHRLSIQFFLALLPGLTFGEHLFWIT